MIHTAQLFFILFLFAECSNPPLQGTVVKVADGDTFTILTEKKKQIRIRLYGIDAPEKGQDFANVSKQHLSELIQGKVVQLTTQKKDRYDRIVAIAYINEVNINEEMLRAGLAWHYKAYDNNRTWTIIESQARKDKRGIWSLSEPTPPWKFRETKRRSSKKQN